MGEDLGARNRRWWQRMSNALPADFLQQRRKKEWEALSNNAHVALCPSLRSYEIFTSLFIDFKISLPFPHRTFQTSLFFLSFESFDLHWKNEDVLCLDAVVEQYYLYAKGNEITIFSRYCHRHHKPSDKQLFIRVVFLSFFFYSSFQGQPDPNR